MDGLTGGTGIDRRRAGVLRGAITALGATAVGGRTGITGRHLLQRQPDAQRTHAEGKRIADRPDITAVRQMNAKTVSFFIELIKSLKKASGKRMEQFFPRIAFSFRDNGKIKFHNFLSLETCLIKQLLQRGKANQNLFGLESRYFFTMSATLKVMACSNSRRSRPVSLRIFSRR